MNVEEQCKEKKKKMEKIPRRLKNKYKYQMKKKINMKKCFNDNNTNNNNNINATEMKYKLFDAFVTFVVLVL